MTANSVGASETPEAQLKSFIERFDAKEQKLLRAVRSAVRKRFPTANELAYDYGTHIVIAYSSTESAPDGIVAIDARADGVRLYFTHGKKLRDPKKLLEGSATQVRYVRLESAKQLAHPDVEALVAAAIEMGRVPLAAEGRGKLVIRPTAASKRAR